MCFNYVIELYAQKHHHINISDDISHAYFQNVIMGNWYGISYSYCNHLGASLTDIDKVYDINIALSGM